MTADRNMYENVAFGEGRVGHIQMRSGGEQATKPEDTVVVNEAGVLMHHGDEFDTVTFIPVTNIAWVKTRSVRSNKHKELPERTIVPVISLITDGRCQYPTEAPGHPPCGIKTPCPIHSRGASDD